MDVRKFDNVCMLLLETFGVPKQDVEPVHNVITQVFDGLKKAGLTAAKTGGDLS